MSRTGRAPTGSSRSHQWWRPDPHHILRDGKKTFRGRDASDWPRLDGFETVEAALADDHVCQSCKRAFESRRLKQQK
ncbi:MAG: hypothetical protein AAFR64_14050 [Pseudomonadota bacterium]